MMYCSVFLLAIADQHVKTISVGEGCDQSCDKGMSGHCSESVSFIADVFNLLQPDDCRN